MGPCMQEEMSKKIEKWQEKGPAKQGRVLPVPDMEPKKRRGGKRARKYKERYGLTDTKKARSAVPHRHRRLHAVPLTQALRWLPRLLTIRFSSALCCISWLWLIIGHAHMVWRDTGRKQDALQPG